MSVSTGKDLLRDTSGQNAASVAAPANSPFTLHTSNGPDNILDRRVVNDNSPSKSDPGEILKHEQYVQAILNGSPISILITNKEASVIHFANHRWFEMLAIKDHQKDTTLGLDFWVNTELRTRLLKQLHQDGRGCIEGSMVNTSGAEIAVNASCMPNPGNNNEILWWLTDITEQKRTENQLLQNERVLEQIIDHLPVALWVKDINNNFRHTVYNKASENLFGCTADFVLGKSEFEYLDYDVAQNIRHEDLEIVRTGQMLDIPEDRIKSANGEIMFGHTIKLAIPDADGTPSLILGLSEDLTERIETAKALKVSERRFRELAANAPVGIFLTDPQGACIYVNEQWQKMSGLNQEQAAGMGWMTTLHEADRSEMTTTWKNFIAGNSDFCMECRFVRPDGKITWAAEQAAAFKNEADEIIGYLGSVTDITHRKQYEIELQLSRDAAERANAAKSDFLSRMSHELRTPLNAVMGFAQLLQLNNHNLTPNQNDGVNQIMASGQHLLHLIEDVLDFSRIDSRHMSLNFQSFALGQVLQGSIALVKPLSETGGHSITISDDHSARIFADPWRTQQVLVNLLTNAIKYSKTGGTVTVSSGISTDKMVRTSVKDTGFGIQVEEQSHLFEPFERAMDSNHTIEGTGIGLSICKKLVEMMGGQIGFDSECGAGSTFWFDLPAASAADPDKNPTNDAPVAEQLQQLQQLKGIRILYVENHLASIKLMMEIARTLPGCELITSSNLPDGVALAKSSHADLVMMDINLPGLGGFEALAMLKSDKRSQKIPVIAVSANITSELISRSRDAGFAQILAKPFNQNDLLQAILASFKPRSRSRKRI